MLNAYGSMDASRVACAAIVLVLSATSCIELKTAERRPVPKVAPEPPRVASFVPEASAAFVPAASDDRELPSSPLGRNWRLDQHRVGEGEPAQRAAPRGVLSSVDGGDDTWEQIRYLMTLVPVQPEVSSLREFRRKLRRYHGNQQFFEQMGNNARRWLYHVARALAARGMPGELALLPAVESGYNAAAVSSRNAAGLWQILPGTARDLDVKASWWYDGRHDALAATPAALRYLKSLHDELNGDWMLAVAAYNCGPNNVRKAIRRAGLDIETAHYAAIERFLPRETRGHMARWLVLSEIVAEPRLHNVRIGPIPWRPYFAEVAARPRVELAAAARRSGLPASEIEALNLGFRRGAIAPNGPHRLLVPAEYAGHVSRALSRVESVRYAGRTRYRIRTGDTLGTIAQNHGTTVKALMTVNALDSHLIVAGRELLVPGPAVRDPEPGARASRTDTHVVSPGESLWLIARQYQTTVDSLRSWNRLSPGSNMLRPGQTLRIRREG